jgi:hypothetical protein
MVNIPATQEALSNNIHIFHSVITAHDINLKYDLNVNVRRFLPK